MKTLRDGAFSANSLAHCETEPVLGDPNKGGTYCRRRDNQGSLDLAKTRPTVMAGGLLRKKRSGVQQYEIDYFDGFTETHLL